VQEIKLFRLGSNKKFFLLIRHLKEKMDGQRKLQFGQTVESLLALSWDRVTGVTVKMHAHAHTHTHPLAPF
jgi:hypothetical protein